MQGDFQKMINRALEIKEKYKKKEPKEWTLEQNFMGMTKDVGELSELIMAYKGYRKGPDNLKEALGHEISDILWVLMVISDELEIDIEKSFHKTMDNLEGRLQ